MKQSQSISTKFRTTFLLIAILPVIIFGVVSYVQTRMSAIGDKERQLLALAESKRANLETWMQELRHRSSAIRQLPEFAQLIPRMGRQPLEHEGPSRRRRMREPEEGAETLLDRAITSKLQAKEDYSGVFVYAPNGDLVYSLAKDAAVRGTNIASEDYFIKGRDQDVLSNVKISPYTGGRCFYQASPIRNEFGQLVGVLVLEIHLDRVLRIFNTRGAADDATSMLLLTRDGEVLFDGRIADRRMRSVNEMAMRVGQGSGLTGMYENEEGIDVIGAFVPYPEAGIVIGMEVPVSQALLTSNMLLYVNITGVLVIALLIFIVARYFANRFAGPIISMTRTAALVADGDLRETIRGASNDELGTLAASFNSMVQSLASINRRIQEMAGEIGLASNEILASTEEQEHISMQQSAAVSETSATIEELSVAARQVAQSAQSIMKQVEGTASKIMFLSQKTQEIDKISTVIEEVAQQIHLLSLNASIEAARAGEHGKGFGVVAAEIRKLSEKSNKQTADIAHIIEDIQNAISSVVMATEQAVNGVRSITISVQEQDAATEQIAQSMQDINAGMRQSIESTKQTKASVEQLERVMSRMNEFVRQFKIN